jgi:hypothetical protein
MPTPLDRSVQTDARAKPARPEAGAASGASGDGAVATPTAKASYARFSPIAIRAIPVFTMRTGIGKSARN